MKNSNYIAALVKRAKKKDLLAQRTLYELFAKEMLTVSVQLTNNQEEAKDILQEAFLTSFLKIKQLKEPTYYRAWLKKIVINASLKAVKARTRFEDVELLSNESIPVNEPDFFDIPIEKIQESIQKLPDGCRQIFTLYLLEEYKHKEIAALLDISVSTSKSQYQYALKLLRQTLCKQLS